MEPVLPNCELKLALEWSVPDQGHYGPLLNPGVHLHLAPEVELLLTPPAGGHDLSLEPLSDLSRGHGQVHLKV